MSDLGNKKVMAKNILYYMEINGKTRNDICDGLNIKYSTFSEWVSASKYPRIDKIEMLAKYFGIQKSDLIENKLDAQNDTELVSIIWNKFNQLSLEKRADAIKHLDYLLALQNQVPEQK
jgi:repressor LexA